MAHIETTPSTDQVQPLPAFPVARRGLGPSETSSTTSRSRAELGVRRVLCVPYGSPSASASQAERLFSISIVLSAMRCLLTYIAIPVLGPLIGSSVTDSPAVGIPLAVLALVFDVRSVRRFWMADHRWRWQMTAVYVVVAAMVSVLLAQDINRLFS